MKVNELAKDLEKTNKEVNDTLQKNVEEKNNASGTAGGQAAEKKEPAGKPAMVFGGSLVRSSWVAAATARAAQVPVV